MREDLEEEGREPFEPGWRERLWAIGAAAGRLFDTRAAIFQEELGEKGKDLGKALAGLSVALLFGALAGLLLTALVAALFTRLLGSLVLGILATLVLDLAVAAGAGAVAMRKLSRLRPFEFPATRREIDRDLDAVRRAAGIGEREPREAPDDRGSPRETPEEMESRLRGGAV